MIAPKAGVTFREMLCGGHFYYGAEVVATRGFHSPGAPNPLTDTAAALLADPRIGWISITDNPGGAPMLPPDWLAGLFPNHRSQIVLHLTCKDMNRNALEAAAWRCAAEGFDNVLAMTGDYPTTGFGGTAAPVFDLDSVGLVSLLRSMNEGLRVPGRRGGMEILPPTRFFIGSVVSPFKRHERELLPQYFKLLRKIEAGAGWVICQLGYDMRKFHEVKLLLASRGLDLPVVGNAYLLNRGAARAFHDGRLAGCVVSDALLAEAEKYSAGPDKGRSFFRQLAARQLAVFKGLGFAAGFLAGTSRPETFADVIDLAESYAPDDWRDFLRQIRYSQPGEFFFFDHDPATGLCAPERINPEYLRSLRKPPRSREVTLGYRLSRLVHGAAFEPGRGLYRLLRWLFRRWDRRPGLLSRLARWLEKESKHLGYACQDCGDCSLAECAFLCPLAGCPKAMRNGPCGGSAGGRCEVDDRECFWARVYQRLRHYGQSESMLDGPVVIYHADLKNTSGWANFYLRRDHHAKQQAAGSRQRAPSGGQQAAGGGQQAASGDTQDKLHADPRPPTADT